MGVTANIDIRQIRDQLEREVRKNIHRVIASLQYVGETVVNEIRTSHISDWNDRTGNLRSSVGYILSVDGQPMNMSGFERVDGPDREKSTEDGSESGRAYAQSLCSLYPKGIALIVVAGMEYAAYVEAMENKVVLAQGEIEARKLVSEMLQELNSRYSK